MKILEIICLTVFGCGTIWILTLISAVGIGGILDKNLIWKFGGTICIGIFLIAGYFFAKESLYK
jgi:hypothetical protein